MLKQIWKDQVWAAVIATGITAVLGSAGAYSLGYWPAIKSSMTAALNFLLSKSEISNWIIGLIAIPAALIVIILIAAIWSIWRTPKNDALEASKYKTDKFFGLRWRWIYYEGLIAKLTSYCPYCDFQVFSLDASRYATIDRIKYKCDSCNRELGTHDESELEIKSKVERFIQQKIRSGAWKSVQNDDATR